VYYRFSAQAARRIGGIARAQAPPITPIFTHHWHATEAQRTSSLTLSKGYLFIANEARYTP
jgi:hypothetical protein